MKYFLLLLAIICTTLSCSKPKEKSVWNVVPYPNSITVEEGIFSFNEPIHIIVTDTTIYNSVGIFKKKLSETSHFSNQNYKNTIILNITDSPQKNEEDYKIIIEKHKITIKSSHPKGIFYGLMTICQAVKFSENNAIPCGIIEDSPRFKYRGFMLDESRHFFGKKKVLEIIDQMSFFKLNTFHWHLTDRPAWRIEIKAYPKLGTIGGKGNYLNPDTPAKYYTQEELKEIVAYAAERFITIIPEISMPGHATAANRAYPEYSGGGTPGYPHFTFNPGKEETYAFLTTILKEVAEIFPSEYIHLGGDENYYGVKQWDTDKHVKLLMKQKKYTTIQEVESYFMERIADSLSRMGKKIAGWDEISESITSKEDLLVYWVLQSEKLKKDLKDELNIVLCPKVPLYFNFAQHNIHKQGKRRSGFGTIKDVYNFPDETLSFSSEEIKLIRGIQGVLMTRKFRTNKWLDFMMYPRIISLAESAWTQKENKNFIRFNSFLPPIQDYLDELNIYYFDHLNEIPTYEPSL